MAAVALVDRGPFRVGESPVWDADNARLYWTDIPAGTIHALDTDTGRRQRWSFDEPVAAFGLCRSGRLVVGLRESVILFEPATGRREVVATLAHAKEGMRLNDGKVGPDGAFWIGSMDATGIGAPAAQLFRVAADGSVRILAEGLATSNGLAWSPDGRRMYHSDSRGEMALWAWDFDPLSGAADNRRQLSIVNETLGRADGGACDMAGNYWSCAPSQSRINRFSSEGALLDWIDLPARHPTMPCFGGPDLRTLYITSLAGPPGPEQERLFPYCGGVMALNMETPGVPVARFAD